ncbi:LPP20 family lipoprotein [Francisellaceae bacterium CB299]|jgi:hypothetical protein
MSFQILKKVYLCILAVSLISCSTTKPVDINSNIITSSQKKELSNPSPKSIVPTWFTQELNNDDSYLYGIGSDSSYKKATDRALVDMIQKLQVTVSANTSLQTISSNNNISQKLVQEISTQTADINIPNYKIINQDESNGIFYIQLQINVNETIATLQQTILNQTKESLLIIQNSENKSFLTRFDIAQKLDHKIQTIKSSLRTLIILAPDTDIEIQMIQLNQLENQSLNLKRNITVKIVRNNSGYFFDSLKKYLQVNNFHYSRKNSNIEISLKLLDYDTSIKDGKYCIKTKVELQASDAISNQLKPKTYTMNACSDKGRLTAIDKLNEAFYHQLNNAPSIY